jgi:TolB-like protein/DNA-binding SARP family transcriptional activator
MSGGRPTIRLEFLGGLQVILDGQELRDLPAQPTRAALLLHVALEGRVTRDEAAALLWPEREPDRGRHSLRQTLYELRRTLGPDWCEAHGDTLQAGGSLNVDALDFLAATEEGRDEAALELYRGPFLRGVDPGLGYAFEAWVEGWRARLERRHRELCRRLHRERLGKGNGPGALEVARRWCAADPLDDEAHHALVAGLAAAGRRAEAVRCYDDFAERIRAELDVDPLDSTQALVEAIRAGGDAAADRGEDGTAKPPGPLPGQEPAPPPPPLPDAVLVPPSSGAPTRSGRRGPSLVGGTALLVLGVLVAWGAFWRGAPGGPVPGLAPLAGAGGEGIAVLPFENRNPSADDGYFADGVTEDLITALSRIDGLRVISRASALRYRETTLSVPQVAGELGVRFLLTGSVRREGDQVRITAQLLDAPQDDHLWAETYDRELLDVFQVQSEIAGRIADALAQRIGGAPATLAAGGTRDLEAWDLYLRGREYLNRPGEADLQKYELAIGFFRRAVELDPDYAHGYAALSEAWRRHVALPLVPIRRDSVLHYAALALDRSPELPEAVVAMGYGRLFAGDPDGAEPRFREALDLDPNQADAWEGLALLAALEGALDSAVLRQARAVQLDPLAVPRLLHLASYLFDMGALERAGRLVERAVALAPDHPEANYLMAQVERVRGREGGAEDWMEALLGAASPHPGVDFALAQHHADMGRPGEVEAVLAGSPLADSPAVLVLRAVAALEAGDTARARELIREPDALLGGWEAEGLWVPPRGQIARALVRGDPGTAVSLVEALGQTGLRWVEDPPRVGIYWLDLEPVGRLMARQPGFPAVLAGLRSRMDAMRRTLPLDLVRPQDPIQP